VLATSDSTVIYIFILNGLLAASRDLLDTSRCCGFFHVRVHVGGNNDLLTLAADNSTTALGDAAIARIRVSFSFIADVCFCLDARVCSCLVRLYGFCRVFYAGRAQFAALPDSISISAASYERRRRRVGPLRQPAVTSTNGTPPQISR